MSEDYRKWLRENRIETNGATDFERSRIERRKVNNLFGFDTGYAEYDAPYCQFCNKKYILTSRKNLLQIFANNPTILEDIRSTTNTETFCFCAGCGDYKVLSKVELKPVSDRTHVCGQCRGKTLSAKFENGKWAWTCSSCKWSYDMRKSELKKTYTEEPKSFIMTTPKKKKQPGALDEDDIEDLKRAGFSTLGAYKVDSR